jgi:hypothetical protein
VVLRPQHFSLGRDPRAYGLKRWAKLAGGFEYQAVNAAIARVVKRLKIDRELQAKIKMVLKALNMNM